jgi:hypothetical protein
MPIPIPALIGLALTLILVVLSGNASAAENDCEAIPAGRARTDCFILRARVHGLKANIAADKARQESSAAKLDTQKGEVAGPDSTKQRPK